MFTAFKFDHFRLIFALFWLIFAFMFLLCLHHFPACSLCDCQTPTEPFKIAAIILPLHFSVFQLPGACWAIILSILIITMFKERINDYLEKKLGQYLENWPRYCNFCQPINFLKNFENFIFQT